MFFVLTLLLFSDLCLDYIFYRILTVLGSGIGTILGCFGNKIVIKFELAILDALFTLTGAVVRSTVAVLEAAGWGGSYRPRLWRVLEVI